MLYTIELMLRRHGHSADCSRIRRQVKRQECDVRTKKNVSATDKCYNGKNIRVSIEMSPGTSIFTITVC